MSKTLSEIVAEFGATAKSKLKNAGVSGAPEDQLRAPLETLITQISELAGLAAGAIVPVGETSLAELKTRPDYAVTFNSLLVGFIELKAPGKGADPRRFTDKHDKEQWEKLKTLPNLIYTDGNSFSLWHNGDLHGNVVHLDGDIEVAGNKLTGPIDLLARFSDFFQWEPQPPKSAPALAEMTARLCRLLREEVTEQLSLGSGPLTNLATDWRKLLFPNATDAAFADGYAQAVTFGMLMARARKISLKDGLDRAAKELRQTNTLIGTALRLLTDDAENQETLKTSLATLTRVLDAVEWDVISKGDPEAWLYFYEKFLKAYDDQLRRKTGSYYTPPEVVVSMVRLVDEALRSSDYFDLPDGLGNQNVTVADPATGTGTYLLGILRRIAETKEEDEGEGAVAGAIKAAIPRLIGFELQFGPFAVAQLRLLAELRDLAGDDFADHADPMRIYVTDTLGNPYVEDEYIPQILMPLGESRRKANEIKKQEKITVVIGNPPYKDKAKGLGGWVESGNGNRLGPLMDWIPPASWNVGTHTKHLRNLYVYFWRWATWKVFGDGDPTEIGGVRARDQAGIVSFISAAGFLGGDGFQKMRADLREQADEIWVIDCSPEGHQPPINTRIFQDVQQPICIVMALRRTQPKPETPARVRYRVLNAGDRKNKFDELKKMQLDGDEWMECSSLPRSSFFPEAVGSWKNFPKIEDMFSYDATGVMPGRVWVISPDRASLEGRWNKLTSEKNPTKQASDFQPHMVDGKPADKHINKPLKSGIYGHEFRSGSVASDKGPCIPPVRYSFRSFDRQWIIPDGRLINRPNPTLWEIQSKEQVHLISLEKRAPSNGPAITFAAHPPDLNFYKGSSGGRIFPLWSDRNATTPNIKKSLLDALTKELGISITGQEFIAYLAAVIANPFYTERFKGDLVQPGLRVPITSDKDLFREAVDIGGEVIWLHTFGERFADPSKDRAANPPRLPKGEGPTIPKNGAIPTDPLHMPDEIFYDAPEKRLHVGGGFIDGVAKEVWEYEVSGKQILVHWFSYRKKDRSRATIGERRLPSALEDIQPDHWLAEYTSELLNVLHVLARLVALEPKQANLLQRICDKPTITLDALQAAGAFDDKRTGKGGKADDRQKSLI